MQNSFTPEYQKPLPKNTSLVVYKDDKPVFQSSLNWLYPLFDLEEFLQNNFTRNLSDLCIHDHIIGKAAIAIILKLGIKKIHTDTISNLALSFVESINSKSSEKILITYQSIVPKILCQTEDILEPLFDISEIYGIVKARAKR